MREPLTIRQQDLPSLTGMPLSVSLLLLKKANVRPIDTGKGRGRGLFWSVDAVKMVMRQLHDQAQQAEPRSRKRRSVSKPVLDCSLAAIMEELNRGRCPVQ